jgi:penicillin amidase
VQTGIVDSRPRGWTGAVPRPGWDLASRTPAPVPESSRPMFFDPPEGFLASANERRDGPHGERWCTVPEPPYRHQRLTQLLEAEHHADLGSLVRASYDDVDLCAARLLPIWEPLLPADDAAGELCAWAKAQRPGGGAEQRRRMGLFQALHRETVRGLLRRHLGAERADALVDFCQIVLMTRHHIDAVLALEKPRVIDADGLREILAEAWPAAQGIVAGGRALTPVRTSFRNLVFDGKLPGFLGFDSAPVELPGGPTVPFQCQDIRFGDFRIIAGPVFHLAFDLRRPGGWYNIGGGASEQRLGPGYGKGVEDWVAGRFHPLGDASGPAPALGNGPLLHAPRS